MEAVLTQRIGDAGKRLHTARSRNDQVAVDIRLNLRNETDRLLKLLEELIALLSDMAETYADVIMPGYTHLQRAQPITFGHHLLAYAEMLLRDRGRLIDAKKRMNVCPLGAGALAGTTYPIDREMTAKELGFDAPARNSLDAVSDRDFCIELASALSIIMVHLSRFSEEIILWCSHEFKFIELDDAFSTQALCPKRKTPTSRCRGAAGLASMTLLTVKKRLPLAYNKDMQEDKGPSLTPFDTVSLCLMLRCKW